MVTGVLRAHKGAIGCIGLNLHIKYNEHMGILWAHVGTIGCVALSLMITLWTSC